MFHLNLHVHCEYAETFIPFFEFFSKIFFRIIYKNLPAGYTMSKKGCGMRRLFVLFLVCCLTSAYGDEVEIKAADFNRVVLMGKAVVHIRQSDKESLKISGSKKTIDEVAASVKYGELVITHAASGWFSRFFPSAELPVYRLAVKDLRSLILKGSGEVFGEGPIKAEELKLVIEGAGQMQFDLDVKELKAAIFGAGKITLKGKAENQIIDIEGRGIYQGQDLVSKKGKLTINGSGDAEINAKEELDVTINGSGNVVYFGKPKVNKHISGQGNVFSK